MRCFFLKNGRIVSAAMLPWASEQDALAKSQEMFSDALPDRFDSFELREMTRLVTRYDGAISPICLLTP